MQQQETKKTRRIRQISVTNLFGTFNHVIPLKMDEHVTIIHGPNGFGKTVMLKLLHSLFSQNDQSLHNIPFDEFKVDFEDNTSFWVSKAPQSQDLTEEERPGKREIVFYATDKEPAKILPGRNIPPSRVERLVPYLIRVGPESWRNLETGEHLSLRDIEKRFSDPFLTERFGPRTNMSEWLVDMRKSVRIRFIETQRLLSSSKPTQSSEYAVTEDSRHLVEEIKRKLAESATLSESLDSTFPERAINPTSQQLRVTKDELLDQLQKLEEKRSRLMTVGLLDQKTRPRFPISSGQKIEDTTKTMLAVYAEDTEQKLGIFDELARRIDLLTTIINDRFLYKAMTVSKEEGIVFTTKNGANLPLENLSSGEQHELVLFYDLLFRVNRGTLVLIDEPELSLHVVWQEQFLKDIQQITELTNIDIIIATHSPDIIGDRRDLMVELKWPDENGEQRK